jgi:hypothetical protein
MKSIYLIGALRNPKVPLLARDLRKQGWDVFDDWFAPGPEADSFLLKYEKTRGHGYKEALSGYAARHIFGFDKLHIDRCQIGILQMPAGKSGHLELGYMIGQGKKGYILFDKEPERFDVMYQFASGIFFSRKELFSQLKLDGGP